jgi:hypothetical protein
VKAPSLLDTVKHLARFIENVSEDDPNRSELFFECREMWRNAIELAEAQANAKLPTLAIILEGGIVQCVVSDNPSAAVAALNGILVIDYDTEGADEVSLVRQKPSRDAKPGDPEQYAEAVVTSLGVELAGIGLGDDEIISPDDKEG